MAGDYSFTRSPTWLAGHVVALIAIVVFANLGLWQLRRQAERDDLDQRIEQQTALAPVPIESLLTPPASDPSAIDLRQVTATGVYDVEAEVILNGQSLNGLSGHNVLTPLVLADGSAVIVNRGWIPIDAAGPPVPNAEPSDGEVTVNGIVRLSQARGAFGPVDPPEGVLERIARVDIPRLQAQVDRELVPVWVLAAGELPRQPSELPLVVPPPEPGGGAPHLSYAVQWFVFAGIVLIGYPVLLYRTARRSRGPGSASA